jgi:ferredoxin
VTRELRVDPIACEGHGLCAELFPERIRLDDWGYPIVARGPIPKELEKHARRAADACPVLALRLRRQAAGTSSSAGAQSESESKRTTAPKFAPTEKDPPWSRATASVSAIGSASSVGSSGPS